MEADWKRFGWREFVLEIPDAWELGGLAKDDDEKSGYIRLDDRYDVRLEIKWRVAEVEPDLGEVRDQFLGQMKETAEEHDATLTVRNVPRHDDFVPRRPGRRVYPFQWSGGAEGDGAVIYCTQCDRLTILQIISPEGRRDNEEVRHVMASFEDHRAEKTLWALHGLECLVPIDLKLEAHELKTGYIGLSFEAEQERPVSIERFGLAKFIMSDKESLEHWLRDQYAGEIGRMNLETRPIQVHGHDGVVAHATRPGTLGSMMRATRHRFNKKAITYKHWRAWHCEETNAIYVVYQGNQGEDDELLPQLAADVTCHRGARDDQPDQERFERLSASTETEAPS